MLKFIKKILASRVKHHKNTLIACLVFYILLALFSIISLVLYIIYSVALDQDLFFQNLPSKDAYFVIMGLWMPSLILAFWGIFIGSWNFKTKHYILPKKQNIKKHDIANI